MIPHLIRLLKRHRPRGGWAILGLTLTALVCLPAALAPTGGVLDAGELLSVLVVAAGSGLGLAWSGLPARRAGLVGGLVGAAWVVMAVGGLLPPLPLLGWEIGHLADWLQQRLAGGQGWPLPFAATGAFAWQQIEGLGMRLWGWVKIVGSGGQARDPTPFLLVAAALAWAFGLLATWQIYRHKRPMVGLLPSGVALAVLAFFAGTPAAVYLIAYLFCLLWLVALCHLWSERERWDQTATDYPDDLGIDLAFAVGPGLALIVVLATFVPVVQPRQIRDAFWEVMAGPWSTVEQASDRLIGPIVRAGPGGAKRSGLLPQAHLLGGQPELLQTIMFYVATNDPPPQPSAGPAPELLGAEVPRRYWRRATYDTYTGNGWSNGPLEARGWPAGEPLGAPNPAGFELRQDYELPGTGETALYAVNAPLHLDQPVQSWWRGPGDLVELTGRERRYTAISRPPSPSREALRAAPPTLPPEVAEHYLALPDTVPERVVALAQEVVAGAETRYDQAHAIEAFLRAYTYTLEVPLPPANRDLVDYFLFDLQRGYCDYFASAMVVMGRAVGIPARLAVGYAQGTFDGRLQRWVVAEKDGHSWVEVYFDGIGWVEFEPTAGQPALRRPGSALIEPPGHELPRRVPGTPAFPWLLALAGMVALLAAFVAWIWWPRRQQAGSPADLVRERQARLLRWGARLGEPLRDGQTALEYGQSLGARLEARGRAARWARAREAGARAPQDVGELIAAFVRAQYSPTPITAREEGQIRGLWTRLRRHLWWLWLGRP